jgi:hypothetical protein
VLANTNNGLSACAVRLGGAFLIEHSHFETYAVGRGEALRGQSKNLFELPTKVGIARKIQFGGRGFAGVALRDQFFSQTTLEFAQPLAWSLPQVSFENSLQVSLRDRTKSGHPGWLKLRLFCHLFPILGSD